MTHIRKLYKRDIYSTCDIHCPNFSYQSNIVQFFKFIMSDFDEQAVNNFREYLRIPSVHPNVNYEPCVEFLKRQAKELDLAVQICVVSPNNPVVVLTWQGSQPELSAIMLNSHMDVVPVYEDSWTHKPFDAHMDTEGNIFARGAQDMKCVGIQYLEAIRRLKHRNITLKRTIHITFVPDEEIGTEGMKKFVKTNDFENLNIGFALDEGIAVSTDKFAIFYGERSKWSMQVHCPGHSGHGSLLLDDTPGEKVRYIIDKFMDFRAVEKQKLKENPDLKTADVTTVNLTILQGGVQDNVIPEELFIVFDVRIAITRDIDQFEQMVDQWCHEAGPDVWVTKDKKEPQYGVTPLDNTNPYWVAFKSASDELKLELVPQICPAVTDSRFLRGVGIPAIGFSPMNNTPNLIHGHNEFLNKSVFLRGIEIYCELIPAIANVEEKTVLRKY